MKQESLITVIIPVFNGEKYIKRAIQSVINQTFNNFECLIIDDGSTDSTAGIIDNLNLDSNYHYYYQKNAGVSVARNKGISLAKGKYIAFLDVDDIWHPNKLECQLRLFIENSELVLVCTGVETFENKSKLNSIFDKDNLDVNISQNLKPYLKIRI